MNKLLTIASIIITSTLSTQSFAQATIHDVQQDAQHRQAARDATAKASTAQKAKPHPNVGVATSQAAKGISNFKLSAKATDINGDDFVVAGKITYTLDGVAKTCSFSNEQVSFSSIATVCGDEAYYGVLQIKGDDKATHLEARIYQNIDWAIDPRVGTTQAWIDEGRADRAPTPEDKKGFVDVKLEGGI